MPLALEHIEPRYDPETECVVFRGHDYGRPVICAVTQEALMDFRRIAEASEAELLSVFDLALPIIRTIAWNKFKAGQRERDGRILITSAELC